MQIRLGLTPAERSELKQLYRLLFRSGKNLRAALAEARQQFTGAAAKNLMDFVAVSKRGIVADVSYQKKAGETDSDESE